MSDGQEQPLAPRPSVEEMQGLGGYTPTADRPRVPEQRLRGDPVQRFYGQEPYPARAPPHQSNTCYSVGEQRRRHAREMKRICSIHRAGERAARDTPPRSKTAPPRTPRVGAADATRARRNHCLSGLTTKENAQLRAERVAGIRLSPRTRSARIPNKQEPRHDWRHIGNAVNPERGTYANMARNRDMYPARAPRAAIKAQFVWALRRIKREPLRERRMLKKFYPSVHTIEKWRIRSMAAREAADPRAKKLVRDAYLMWYPEWRALRDKAAATEEAAAAILATRASGHRDSSALEELAPASARTARAPRRQRPPPPVPLAPPNPTAAPSQPAMPRVLTPRLWWPLEGPNLAPARVVLTWQRVPMNPTTTATTYTTPTPADPDLPSRWSAYLSPPFQGG